jgi:hypothetical protein
MATSVNTHDCPPCAGIDSLEQQGKLKAHMVQGKIYIFTAYACSFVFIAYAAFKWDEDECQNPS